MALKQQGNAIDTPANPPFSPPADSISTGPIPVATALHQHHTALPPVRVTTWTW